MHIVSGGACKPGGFALSPAAMVHLVENWRPRRSVLFMPASNERALAKAASLPCDALIFDLEDSVAPEQQEAARANLLAKVRQADFGPRERIVRTSASGHPEFARDFETAIQCEVDAILLPKVETAGELAAAAARLDEAGSDARLWAMIESPRAILDIREIASATPSLCCLVLGPNDLAKSTGVPMRPGRAAMIPWFMHVVAAARAHGLAVLDGVYNAFRDAEGFAAECAQAAELGFDGKTLIHPSQIEPANAAFSPSAAELEHAARIVAAFATPEATGRGAIQIDGEMVERLHLDSAVRLLKAFADWDRSGAVAAC